MQTQHRDWLAAAKSARQGGLTLRTIVRGQPYDFRLKIPLDVSADSFAAALRLSPDAAGGEAAVFSVSVGAWDGTYTPVEFSLSKSQTNALPADSDLDGLAELVFDILRQPSGGAAERYLAGNVFVSGKVTDNV